MYYSYMTSSLFLFFKYFIFYNLFINFWLFCIFIVVQAFLVCSCGERGLLSKLKYMGFSLQWFFLLLIAGSRAHGTQ